MVVTISDTYCTLDIHTRSAVCLLHTYSCPSLPQRGTSLSRKGRGPSSVRLCVFGTLILPLGERAEGGSHAAMSYYNVYTRQGPYYLSSLLLLRFWCHAIHATTFPCDEMGGYVYLLNPVGLELLCQSVDDLLSSSPSEIADR